MTIIYNLPLSGGRATAGGFIVIIDCAAPVQTFAPRYMLQLILYYGLILCWALNIFFLARFALRWHRGEPSRLRAWLWLGAIAVLAAALAAALPARGGYDNNHDFMCLGREFFSLHPGILLTFKETSPLFTDSVSDFLSGNSLAALLWKNRLLPVLSLFVFFTGLRRAGAGLTAAGAASAFFFLNFLSPLNASAFSTTSSNIFIWLTSLTAIIDAYKYAAAGPASLAWIISSLVLVTGTRIEFLPASLLILAGFSAAKALKGDKFFLRPANAAVLVLGALLAGAWTIHALTPSPAHQLGSGQNPVRTMFYQLGKRNFGVIAGIKPGSPGLAKKVDSALSPAGTALCLALFLFAACGAAAGAAAERGGARERAALLAVLLLWITYFSFIFQPMDFYPLHFMRHQLYFFVPFVFLFALGMDGFERAAGPRWQRPFTALCLAALALYAALNAKAALSYNGDLRTNDRELQFLLEAQRQWPTRAVAVLPVRNRNNTRTDVLRKYFPFMPDCGRDPGLELFKYVSPEHQVFRDARAPLLEQAPLTSGPAGSSWMAETFPHAYYTAFSGRITETTEPVPVTIGFFRMQDSGRDKAYLDTLDGVCAFDEGDYNKAAAKFALAAAADPSCLNCRYFLAISQAGAGRKAAAENELAAIERISGKELPEQQRALVRTLAAGDPEGAADIARSLSGEGSDLFFGRNFAGRIQELRLEKP